MAFKGKRVVVCGGSRGIGRSIVLAFAEAGAAVSTCARGADGLNQIRADLAKFGGTVHTEVCDLGDADAIARYMSAAAKALGGIDVLVNNASGFGLGNDEAAWAASVNVDLMATVRASHAAPAAEKGQRGSGSKGSGGKGPAAPKAPLPLDDAATQRYAALRAWRAEVARSHNLPAYVIFHDTTLAAIAQRAPRSLEDLQGISGIGARKLEAYGDEVLRVVGT